MNVWSVLRRSVTKGLRAGAHRDAEEQLADTTPRRPTLADGGQPLTRMSDAEVWAEWDPEYLSLQNDPS